MSMTYKYIRFEEVRNEGKKTKRWECINHSHNELLGEVAWNVPWRQYCYYTMADIDYSASCLKDIVDFLDKIKDERQ